ncbi:ferric iron uptake transcriptional regulator [Porticoccus litoralis]|uniref:Ferric uptake regulation protein n=1 Tax=Porticoccus litoralis TaxID=434086 RepID=A0AAW8B4T3_9GAMM|nr:ferric iron uptake transcriptional regulator [Porticoccus litoralis]MDP1520579.1 ferric iron uptake transcriptional regulator [Porticoccus litoralis]
MNDENRELRKAGLKVTVPRLKILQLLEDSGERHMSAEDVYRKMMETGDDVSIATVYRVLTQFESAGLITRHNFDNGPAVYEMDRGEHHDHMVNVDTGKVVEFHSDEIEALQKAIAEKNGYELVGHNLVLYVRPKQ